LDDEHSSQTEKPFPYEFLWQDHQASTSPPRTPLTLNARAENPQTEENPHRSLVRKDKVEYVD